MANEYSILNEMRRCPQQALNEAVRTRLYEGTPAGRDTFYSDLAVPLTNTPQGALQMSARQRQLVELVRGHYEPLADNRLGRRRWGAGIALAAAALGLTFMVGSVKSTDWHVKERQHRLEQRYERAQYFTGHTPFDYNDNKTLEENLESVKTDAQNDRKGGKGFFYLLSGLGILASAGYAFFRRRSPAQPAAQQPAPAAPPNPAPAPLVPAPAAPAPVPPAPVPAPAPAPVPPAPAPAPVPAPNPNPPYGLNP